MRQFQILKDNVVSAYVTLFRDTGSGCGPGYSRLWSRAKRSQIDGGICSVSLDRFAVNDLDSNWTVNLKVWKHIRLLKRR